MTKDNLKGLIVLSSLMTVIGLVLLFVSVNFGIFLADNWLANEDWVDTSKYLMVVEGSINILLTVGGILFGVGLAAIIFTYYKILNNK
ncbi:hypothetical protein JCM21714_1961 [Gracilibacillus boraciitolerans JCM 21714]|uniref:Uncharacterized protein n=1 Tax=Gracilibacillus boraciitolerans JCM 21714 TaxID=1298598 RepID=W4VIH3_9BACI|nr:hypothetical protein [Gracilibacillus boraciitolerans]GAE92936.1 hypothetical protein JCM21714_1961 [Gracilibacillus boraciitolerans JCM 21714]